MVKNVKTQWLTLGKRGFYLDNDPTLAVGQPNNIKKAILFMSSRSKKVIRLCMRFSSVPNRSVQQHPQAPISKSTPLYSAASFFFKEFLNPQVRIKKCQMQNSMAPFLDGVKLSQDYRATTRRLLPKMHLRQNRNF